MYFHPTLSPLAAYVAFGVLHELAHLAAAWWLLPRSGTDPSLAGRPLDAVVRAVLGRYSVVRIVSDGDGHEGSGEGARRAIAHAGWAFSLASAALCHFLHVVARNKRKEGSRRGPSGLGAAGRILLDPSLPVAAYATAIEAIATDLLGLVPVRPYLHDPSLAICFCGNFGVLLLNPSWLSVDGGRAALDVLERMASVTMMRGAYARLSFLALGKTRRKLSVRFCLT